MLRAFPSLASFYANRLILVAEMEKNGLNKEISRSRTIPGSSVYVSLTAQRGDAVASMRAKTPYFQAFAIKTR